MSFYSFCLTSLFALLFLTACTSDPLAEKKKLLKSKTESLRSLTAEIETLQKEIALLDTVTDNKNEKPRRIGVDSVRISTFKHFIAVQGSVDAENNVFTAPQMPGVVTAIMVHEGQKVRKGELMAQLDNSVILNGIEEVKTGLSLATTAFEKQKRLWEQKIGSEIQYLTVKNQKEQLERKLNTLNAQLDMATIKAPVSGTVDEIKLKVGEMASPGYFGIRVVNLDKLSLKGRLGDTHIGKVKVGDVVQVNFPDINQTLDSRVTFVSQQVDRQTRTILFEVELDNRSGVYSGNMVANLMINDQTIPNSVVVPTNVIQRSAEGTFIMVAEKEGENWIARKRKVEAGAEYAGKTAIISGLQANDLFVNFGYSEIVDGQKIIF